MITLPHDGTRLFYNDWGTGRPVVLLNAAMLNSRMWEFQAPHLAARGLRCITYDRRGTGRSDWPWHGYDYDTLADDLAALLDHLDLRDAVLVGYACGGGEAVRYLARHGTGRVGALALVASTTPLMMRTHDNPGGLEPAGFEEALATMAGDRPAFVADQAGCFFGEGPDAAGAALSPALRQWITGLALDCSPRAALEIYRTLFRTDQRAEVAAVDVPTLIVHGDADQGAPYALCATATSALLPDARFVRYEGAAHALFATHAGRLAEDLRAFAVSSSHRASASRSSGQSPTATGRPTSVSIGRSET
ncbi:alpha/beta fold hydrolase [Streptomyces mashuensis]|nr:alpha/beta hydrolase [Streptomyces mashuensis]